MRLRAATEAEKAARDVLTHEAWGSGLTVEQFVAREQVLRAHRWCREVMRTWLWVDDADRVLASCETFQLESRVGAAEGASWSVASVFTERALRGRGHAGRMMKALVAHLGAEPRAQASVLYSEVGAELYRRAGYFEVPAFDLLLAPSSASAAGVQWLTGALTQPALPGATAETLLIAPSADELDWHLERARYYAKALGRRPLEAWGARLDGSTLWWAASYKTDELLVLWHELAAAAHLPPLLAAAQRAAHDAGLARVRLWETSRLELPGAKRVRRDDAVPMFAPLTHGLTAWTHIQRGLWV